MVPSHTHVKSGGFNLKGYNIPLFELKSGQLLRMWIQIIPPVNGKNGYNLIPYLEKLFLKKRKTEGLWVHKAIPFARFIPKRRFQNHFLTVDKFLKKQRIPVDQHQQIKEFLDLAGNLKIRFLGATPGRILSMLAAWEKSDCIAFDYYGLGPADVEKINQLVYEKLQEGKSAIGFDNLYYLEEKEPFPAFTRIIIEQSEP